MRPLLSVLALLLAAAAPRAVALEPVVALRLGIGAAVGSAARDVPASDVVPVQYPVQLDLLGREGALALGAYGSLAPASPGRCPRASCSAWAARVGLQGTWALAKTAGGAEPWLGVASGFEWVFEDRTQGGTVATRYQGPELLALQGGVEWQPWRWLALGPYGLVSLGRFTRYGLDTGEESAQVQIPHRAFHVWLHAGVRGRLVLGGQR